METSQLPVDKNPAPAEVEQSQASSNNRLFLVIVISVLLTAITTGSMVYFWQKSVNQKAVSRLEKEVSSLEKQISAMRVAAISPQPILSPLLSLSPTINPTANWKLYVDPRHKFEFFYPSRYPLGKLGDNLPLLNHKISWSSSTHSYKDCRGDCAVVNSTERVTIAKQEAVKIKGWVGSVGGNIPQSYIKYEILTPDSDYLSFTLWELPQDGDWTQYDDNREIKAIPQKEEIIFDQILLTFKFLN